MTGLRNVYGASRLAGVDAARGLALIGMASVHIFPALRPDGSIQPAYLISAGRAAALFALLAGVGLALLAGGRRLADGRPDGVSLRPLRASVAARALVLVVIGAVLGLVPSPPVVILGYYAALFLAAIPVLGLRLRTLTALAVAWSVLAPVLGHLLRPRLPTPTAAWEGLLGGPGTLEALVTGTYPALAWFTYLLAGLAVGRLDLRSPQVAAALAVGGALLAAGAKLLSDALLSAAGGVASLQDTAKGIPIRGDLETSLRVGLLGTTPTGDTAWLLTSAPHSSTTLDLWHTIGTSLLVLGVCLLLGRLAPAALLPLACAGSMTLTLYSVHIVALVQGGALRRGTPSELWTWHVLVALAVALVWRTQVGRGPLEQLSAAFGTAVAQAVRDGMAAPVGETSNGGAGTGASPGGGQSPSADGTVGRRAPGGPAG